MNKPFTRVSVPHVYRSYRTCKGLKRNKYSDPNHSRSHHHSPSLWCSISPLSLANTRSLSERVLDWSLLSSVGFNSSTYLRSRLLQKSRMAGCAMNCQFSSAVKLRNDVASLRIRSRDFAFGGSVKELKVPVLRINKKQRSRLLMVNMSHSNVEPLSSVVAATEPTEEEGGSILGKGDNVESLGADEPTKLVTAHGGGGGGNGGFNNGGGGGGGGDDGGEDYEEKEFGPLLKFEEVMRETEARGAKLPSDMLEAAKTFGIRKLILLRYLDLQSSAGLLGFAIRSWSMLRNRMLADPSFLFKIGTEIVIDSCCATVAEVQKRGKDFWAEFELYVADLLVGVVVNVALVGMLAPFVRFGQPSASSGFLGPMLNAYNALPSSVFEAERPGCSFSAQQRLATYFYKGIMYGAVGFGCGIVGQGIANLIMTAKRSINKSEEDIPVPPLIKSAALWGVFLSVSSNTRYQIINGLERVVEASPFAKKVPPVALAFTVGVRFANNIYGGMQFVDWARLSGCQ